MKLFIVILFVACVYATSFHIDRSLWMNPPPPPEYKDIKSRYNYQWPEEEKEEDDDPFTKVHLRLVSNTNSASLPLGNWFTLGPPPHRTEPYGQIKSPYEYEIMENETL